MSLGAEVSRVKAERRDRAERVARSTTQGLISQWLRRGRTVEEATEVAESEAERDRNWVESIHSGLSATVRHSTIDVGHS